MIFINEENITNDTLLIAGQDHIHLSRVLRAKINQEIVASDQKLVYNCLITNIFKDYTECKILQKDVIEMELFPKIYVYISATKGDKMELVTQKVTELGAFGVIPFISKRSIVKFDEKSKIKRQKRLQTVAKDAANQCKSMFVPEVSKVLEFAEMLERVKKTELSIVLYENEQKKSFKDIISKNSFEEIAIIIGPEGGFEQSEIEKIQSVGACVATLGKRILRAETAPIACVSAIMYEKDNLS